eukprot:PhM_4_TR18416/c0_g1_i2/m.24661
MGIFISRQGVAHSPRRRRHVGLTIADIIFRVFDFCPRNSVNGLATVAVLWHEVARTHPSWRTPDIRLSEIRCLSDHVRQLVLPCWSAESFDRAVQENRYSNGHAETSFGIEEKVPHELSSLSLCVGMPHRWSSLDYEELVMSTDRQPMPSRNRTSMRGRYVSVKSSINNGGNVRVDVQLDRCSNFSKAWRCHRADPKQH